MRLGRVFLFLALLVGVSLALLHWWPALTVWADAQQRSLQQTLARGVRAARAGEPWAVWTLIGASALYGLAHAVGPGHGKMLIGGAALASRRTAWRMAGIGLLASLTQAATAIALIYGGLSLFALSGRWAIGVTEQVLAPMSFAAVALVGLWIAWRGARALWRTAAPLQIQGGHDHAHDHAHRHEHDHACCAHGPSAAQVERVEGWRDALALIGSIGFRPCSGALIVLVIAWRMKLYAVGAASAVAMGLGTGIVVAGVALAATAMRDAGKLREAGGGAEQVFAGVQIAAGLAVAVLSAALLSGALTAPPPQGILGAPG